MVLEAFGYLVQGGAGNLEQLLRFVADELLGSDFAHRAPAATASHGVFGSRPHLPGRPTVAVLFYRAHLVAGNTRFVDELCDAHRGGGRQRLPRLLLLAALRSTRTATRPACSTSCGRPGSTRS